MSEETLANLSHEERRFPPSEEFAASAVSKAELYEVAESDRLGFWEMKACLLSWDNPLYSLLEL